MSPKKPKDEYGPHDKMPGKCNAPRTTAGHKGKRCRQPAGWGVKGMNRGPCKKHGGATDSVRQHHQKAMALEAVVTYGLPRKVDPHTALLQEVWRTAGHVTWLASIIHTSDSNALVWGPTEEQMQTQKQRRGAASMPHGSFDVETHSGTIQAAPSVWLQMYQKERRHLVDVCKTAIACGIAERQVRLAETYFTIMREMQERIWIRAREAGLLADGVDERHAGLRQIAAECIRDIDETMTEMVS